MAKQENMLVSTMKLDNVVLYHACVGALESSCTAARTVGESRYYFFDNGARANLTILTGQVAQSWYRPDIYSLDSFAERAHLPQK